MGEQTVPTFIHELDHQGVRAWQTDGRQLEGGVLYEIVSNGLGKWMYYEICLLYSI
jgi:hypothetical protein